jgi:hypothetical protein
MCTCKGCKGQLSRPSTAGDGKHLEVDGQEYEVVNNFCYLGDMLDSPGGAELAIATRIRCGWNKYREMAPFLTSKAASLKMKGRVYAVCVRSCLLYASETWPMTKEAEQRLVRTDSRMIRSMCGIGLSRDKTIEELSALTGLEMVRSILQQQRLRWYGHVMRKNDSEWVKKIYNDWEVDGSRGRGRPKNTWDATIKGDLHHLQLSPADTQDRDNWRQSIRHRATQRSGQNTLNGR